MNSHRTSDDVMQRGLKLQIARCRAECRSFAPKIAKNADWVLTTALACGIIIDVAGSNTPGRHMEYAAVAHLVERHLAKVEVASSSLVGRSILWKFSSAGRASALQAEGQRFEPVNFHQTREIRTFYQTVMGSDLLFLWEKVKSWRQKTGGLLTAAILLVFLCKCTV